MPFAVSPVNVSPTPSAGVYQTVDISPYVPAGEVASGALVWVLGTTSAEYDYRIRKKGSTDDRSGVIENDDGQGPGITQIAVGVNAANEFEVELENSSTEFWLVGVYLENEAVFFTDAVRIPSPGSSFTTVDLSGDTGTDTATMAFYTGLQGTQTGGYSARAVGEPGDRNANLFGSDLRGFHIPLSANEQFEHITATWLSAWIHGYHKDYFVKRSSELDVTPAGTGSYEPIDLSAEIPLAANGVYVRLYSNSDNEHVATARRAGSNDTTLEGEISTQQTAWVPVSQDGKIEYKRDNTSGRIALMGYTTDPRGAGTTYTISGQVTDADGGGGVSGGAVRLIDPSGVPLLITTTDANGGYSFDINLVDSELGTFTVRGDADGHLNDSQNVTLGTGTTTYTVNVSLPSPPLAAGLWAWYDLEQAQGIDAHAFNDMTVDVPPSVTTGLNGDAASFDGVDDQLRHEGPIETSFTGDRTFAFWSKGSDRMILGKDSSDREYQFRVDFGRAEITLNLFHSGGTIRQAEVPAPLTTGTWYHIALTYTASTDTFECFVDGVSQFSISQANLDTSNGGAFTVGSARPSVGHAAADMDSFGIWTKVLSQSEIDTLVGGGQGTGYAGLRGAGSGPQSRTITPGAAAVQAGTLSAAPQRVTRAYSGSTVSVSAASFTAAPTPSTRSIPPAIAEAITGALSAAEVTPDAETRTVPGSSASVVAGALQALRAPLTRTFPSATAPVQAAPPAAAPAVSARTFSPAAAAVQAGTLSVGAAPRTRTLGAAAAPVQTGALFTQRAAQSRLLGPSTAAATAAPVGRNQARGLRVLPGATADTSAATLTPGPARQVRELPLTAAPVYAGTLSLRGAPLRLTMESSATPVITGTLSVDPSGQLRTLPGVQTGASAAVLSASADTARRTVKTSTAGAVGAALTVTKSALQPPPPSSFVRYDWPDLSIPSIRWPRN
jgi:hypothetical protein